MSKAIKAKLDTLYKVSAANENSPTHYTPITVEAVSAASNVTIRATTNPDFDGAYSALPIQVSDMAEREIYECGYARSLQFLAFECSDSTAEIYVAGLKMEEVEVTTTEEVEESEGE